MNEQMNAFFTRRFRDGKMTGKTVLDLSSKYICRIFYGDTYISTFMHSIHTYISGGEEKKNKE